MRHLPLLALGTAALLAAGASALPPVQAEPIAFELPEETAEFQPGPGVEVAQANCAACHSADYIATQPKGERFGHDFWQAEVTKMIKVYGAPISEDDAKTIVEYLSQTY